MCRCPTTNSSSASPSQAPRRSSPRRGACCTSTDHGHQGLHGSALPDHGGRASGEVAQAGRRRGEGGGDARRGRDRQGHHGPGRPRRRRAAAGRGDRRTDGAGGERRGGHRGAGGDGRTSGASPSPGACREGGRGRGHACADTCGPHGASDRRRGRHACQGVAAGEAHRNGIRGRPEAGDGFGTRWPSRETGLGTCSHAASRCDAGPGTNRTLPPSPLPVPRSGAPYEDVPLTQIRKTIAKRLATSLGPIPHFFLTTEVDMERAGEARDALNRQLGDRGKVSFNGVIVKATALALTKHRACNAWFQDDHIRYWNEVHIGMAVAVEDGLITPVIRHADLKALLEIGGEARDLAEKARNRRLQPSEYTGATFSVSNLGMFEIDQFTAVINPPEAGIIAVGSIAPKPVVWDGQVVPRRRVRITMSCDHRVIDGATGAAFLKTLKEMLENPLAMLL